MGIHVSIPVPLKSMSHVPPTTLKMLSIPLT